MLGLQEWGHLIPRVSACGPGTFKVGLKRWRCWGLGQFLPCVAFCGMPGRGAGLCCSVPWALFPVACLKVTGYHGDIASWWFPQSCHFWQPCAPFCLLGLEEKGTGNWETKRPFGFPERHCSQSQLSLPFSVTRLGHSGSVSPCSSSGTIPFKVALWVSELHYVLEYGENCQGGGGCLLHTPPQSCNGLGRG